MNFGEAIEKLNFGYTVQRSGWNGKGMFLFLIGEWEFHTDVQGVELEDGVQTVPFICMKTADNKLVPWLASQTDVLAVDWQIMENSDE